MMQSDEDIPINNVRLVFETLFPRVDWTHEELVDTPLRWYKMMQELTTPEEFNFTTFDKPVGADEMVIERGIPFTALCAHHLAPFTGKAHVAYVPDERIVGLSKLPRTVQNMAAGLWTQEALTAAIAGTLQERLRPIGVAVVMTADHTCMSLRGVKVHGASCITSSMLGCFGDHTKLARTEFLSLIKI